MDEEKYYCSECGEKVNESDTKCPKCGASLSDVIDESEFDVVAAAFFNNELEGGIARERLESEGIECYLSADSAGSMNPSLAFTKFVRLMVMKKDIEKATEYLRDMGIIE